MISLSVQLTWACITIIIVYGTCTRKQLEAIKLPAILQAAVLYRNCAHLWKIRGSGILIFSICSANRMKMSLSGWTPAVAALPTSSRPVSTAGSPKSLDLQKPNLDLDQTLSNEQH